jgi:hypothetical protein
MVQSLLLLITFKSNWDVLGLAFFFQILVHIILIIRRFSIIFFPLPTGNLRQIWSLFCQSFLLKDYEFGEFFTVLGSFLDCVGDFFVCFLFGYWKVWFLNGVFFVVGFELLKVLLYQEEGKIALHPGLLIHLFHQIPYLLQIQTP